MLDTLFLQILNMSFTARYVILFVLLARLILQKTPKIFSYALWSVVPFRLVCSCSFERSFSWFSFTGRTVQQACPFPATFICSLWIRSIHKRQGSEE
ncbi:MAG: M56 family metallopeptidase [Oscillospiraceae bacterium]